MKTITIERVRAFNGLDVLVARAVEREAHARAAAGLISRV